MSDALFYFVGSALCVAYALRSRHKQYQIRASQRSLAAAFKESIPSDWHYIAEGALNLALKYGGNDKRLKGYVLRLRKDNHKASGGCQKENPWLESIRFCNNVIVPLLGRRYVQPAIPVPIEEAFIQDLDKIIFDERPSHRQQHHLNPKLRVALLMLDNTCLPNAIEEKQICVELKCKCGFLPTSPFISHPIKKRVDRFTMHQQLKLKNGKVKSISRYCPLDLFSRDKSRVLKTLKNLVEAPQNNFRLFVDGKVQEFKGMKELQKKLSDFPGGAMGLLDIVSDISVHEPLFDRIKSAQMLDELDIEAVHPLYKDIVQRGEKLLPLADGDALLPRTPNYQIPTSQADRHDIVRRFLTSCTAKDCSVMIVLSPDGSAKRQHNKLELPIELEAPRAIVKGFNGFSYSIAVVDLDPKPFVKMDGYLEKDEEIVAYYKKLEDSNELK